MYDYDADDDAEGRRFNPQSDAWQLAVAGVAEMYSRMRRKSPPAPQEATAPEPATVPEVEQ
nr:hypothetical protein KitaXyl93_20900 [Kitasatospora sp. Xyl93]